MNTDESELALFRAERRVREIQAKLHRWADHDPQRDLWSARCPETGTAGAGGGSGKPTGGNTGRAPRADLTALPHRRDGQRPVAVPSLGQPKLLPHTPADNRQTLVARSVRTSAS